MHIPKSAGTALANAIMALHPFSNETHGWDRSLFGSYDEFDTWDQSRRPWMFLSTDEIPDGKDFIFGHIALSNILTRYSDARIFTVIRHPFSRIMSFWTFWRGKPDGLQSDVGTYAEYVYLARGSLESFLSNVSISPQTDNVVARMLLWPHVLIPDDDFIQEHHINDIVELCLNKLEKFDFIDVYENEDWVRNFQSWLGLPIAVGMDNVTESPAPDLRSNIHHELSESCKEYMIQRTQIDDIIWRTIALRYLAPLKVDHLYNKTFEYSIEKFDRILSGN